VYQFERCRKLTGSIAPHDQAVRNQRAAADLLKHSVSSVLFQSANSEKVDDMNSIGKLAIVIAAAGGLGLAALSPAPADAGVIHPSLGRAAAAGDSDVVRVRCERKLSNLWSCDDDVGVRGRRDVHARDSQAHPCDHSYQTARDGTRCGNRAADKRPGGISRGI
jgi:hypothetical protein